jgi:hypothetical protein
MSARAVTDAQMLSYDFFAGDKDDGGRRNYSVRIVTTRRPHECLFRVDWSHEIPAGSRARLDECILDEEGWRRFYSCAECHQRELDEMCAEHGHAYHRGQCEQCGAKKP